jgi:hypothetical protein
MNPTTHWTIYYICVIVFILLFDAGLRYVTPEHENSRHLNANIKHSGLVTLTKNINKFFFMNSGQSQIKIPGLISDTLDWYCCYCSSDKRPNELLIGASDTCTETDEQVPTAIYSDGTIKIERSPKGSKDQCVFIWK